MGSSGLILEVIDRSVTEVAQRSELRTNRWGSKFKSRGALRLKKSSVTKSVQEEITGEVKFRRCRLDVLWLSLKGARPLPLLPVLPQVPMLPLLPQLPVLQLAVAASMELLRIIFFRKVFAL